VRSFEFGLYFANFFLKPFHKSSLGAFRHLAIRMREKEHGTKEESQETKAKKQPARSNQLKNSQLKNNLLRKPQKSSPQPLRAMKLRNICATKFDCNNGDSCLA